MQMKPLGLKLCCLIDHMTTMGVATLCLSFQWRPPRRYTEILNSNLPSGKSLIIPNKWLGQAMVMAASAP